MPTGQLILFSPSGPRNVERGPPCRGRLAAPSRPKSSSEDARGDQL